MPSAISASEREPHSPKPHGERRKLGPVAFAALVPALCRRRVPVSILDGSESGVFGETAFWTKGPRLRLSSR
jgi:hypothetical protein